MILIAHRGNTEGPSAMENNPLYVIDAMEKGFDTEIDVWHIDGRFYLGHDLPTYAVKPDFFRTGMWAHAKNLEALYALRELGTCEYFWHENDKFTLTSSGFIWTFPGQPLSNRSVMVMPELYTNVDFAADEDVVGICTDYVKRIYETRDFRS